MDRFWKWLALVFALSLIYFYPGWVPGHTFVMTDFLTAAYPSWKIASLRFPPPYWEPFLFGGMPFWGAPHADSFYPINQILRMLTTPGYAASLTLFIHSLIGFTFSYLYLRKIGLKAEWAGALGTLYAFGLFWTSMTYSGHISKMVIASYIPAIFWSLEGVFEGKAVYASLLGLFGGLVILAQHAQIVYYTGLTVIIYALAYLTVEIKRGEYKRAFKVSLLGIFSLIVALMIGAAFLLPQYEYIIHYSVRGESKGMLFSKTWSLDPADFVSVFFGLYSGVFETYWGSNAFKINTEYLGAAFAFLSIVGGLVAYRRWRVVAYLISAFLLMTFMTAKFNPLFPLFYHLLPGVKLFRAQSMAAIPLGFVAMALSGFALLHSEKSIKLMPKVLVGGAVASLLVLLAGSSLAIKSGPLASNPNVQVVFEATSGDRMFALLRTLGVWVLVWAILKNRNVKLSTAALSVALIGYGESFLIKGKFIQPVDEASYFSPDGVARYFMDHPGIYRVLNVGYRQDENYLAIFGVQFVGGHHGQQMRSYHDYLGCKSLMFNPFGCSRLASNWNILDSINTKYIVAPVGVKEAALRSKDPAISSFGSYLSKYTEVYNDGNFSILYNPDHLPRFYAQCGDSIVASKVLNYDYVNGYYRVSVDVPRRCKFVLTENWYPHWNAYVDGKAVKVEKYKGTFMAFDIDRGKHEIVFRYESPLEKKAFILYILGFFVSAVVLAVGLALRWRR